MNSDSSSPPHCDGDSNDDKVWRVEVRQYARDGRLISPYTRSRDPLPLPTIFEHDEAKGLFIVTRPDGKAEHYRDSPVRHPIVEPDPDTGEMRPVVKDGRLAMLYLCREEREV